MTRSNRSSGLARGVTVAVVAVTLMPVAARADADLDAALRTFGPRQRSIQPVDRDPVAAQAGAGPVMTEAPRDAAPDGRTDLKAEAASVRQAVQRINEVTNAALADHDRAGLEARLNASVAGVKAWLDDASRPGAPATGKPAVQ